MTASTSPRRSVLGLCLAALFAPTQATLTSTGLTVQFNDVDYFISPYAAGHVDLKPGLLCNASSIFGFKPVTVVHGAVGEADLPGLLSNWTALDDVFQPAFANVVLYTDTSTNVTRLRRRAPVNITPLHDEKVPQGPYFLEVATGALHPVYRLYQDFAIAFDQALLQTPEGRFQTLSAQVPAAASLTIGVPSRLYYTKTAAKPLVGVRVGVKDIFQLAGVKSSNGNRAWYGLYPPNNATGTAVQRLIDAGAVVIGLQMPSQFANGAAPTADWVDYHAPFNPRADGYQDPSASSSGGGTSIASYDWLDLALGTDTGGSIRGPSEQQGIFGLRPTHGSVSLDHVTPLAPQMDTAGLLTRDPELWDVANQVLYGANYSSLAAAQPKYSPTVFLFAFSEDGYSDAELAVIDKFLAAVTGFLHANITDVSMLEGIWSSSKPAGTDATLKELLSTTYGTIVTKEQTALVREPFFRDYAAAHDGRTPFIDPGVEVRWDYADTLPASVLEEALHNKTIFADWFNTKILAPVSDPTQCSSALLMYFGSVTEDNARNIYYPSPPDPPLNFVRTHVSSLSGCPTAIFPIGEIVSYSNITSHDEKLPFTVDVLAARGCDGLLVRLAKDLADAGIIVRPKTGGTLEGGDILLRKK